MKYPEIGQAIQQALTAKKIRTAHLAEVFHEKFRMREASLRDYVVKLKQGWLYGQGSEDTSRERYRGRLAQIMYVCDAPDEVVAQVREIDPLLGYPPQNGITYLEFQERIKANEQNGLSYELKKSLKVHPERSATVKKLLNLGPEEYRIVQGVIRGLTRIHKRKAPRKEAGESAFPRRNSLTGLLQ